MRVLRGRADSLDADRQVTASLVEDTGATGEAGLRVWTPQPHVAFGRRDATRDGYDLARAIAEDHGYPPVEREVGGRAVAFTEGTLAFVLAEPVSDERHGIDERYERVLSDLESAFVDLGADVDRGEPGGAFCPGSHSLRGDGKVAGLAQRVKSDVATVAGVLVVDRPDAVADVLAPVYDALDVPFNSGAVGSVSESGGPADVTEVAGAIEEQFAGNVSVEKRSVRET